VAHSQRPAALAAVKWTLDVVLEYARDAKIRESLTEFNHCHKPGRRRQVFGDMSQRALLVFSGLRPVSARWAFLVHLDLSDLVRVRVLGVDYRLALAKGLAQSDQLVGFLTCHNHDVVQYQGQDLLCLDSMVCSRHC
jgi:hypothetical protein